MGIFTMVAGAISSVISFISGAAPSIGPSIAGFAKNAFSILANMQTKGLDIIKIISTSTSIIHNVADILGIKTEENTEILGAKAEQSDKSLEDFNNDTEEYIKYLKEEIELDKELIDNMTPEKKMGCNTIGMALETKAIEEKIGGIEIPPEFIATLTQIQFSGINISANELVGIIKVLKDSGITNLNDVTELLEGKGDSDRIKTGEALASALGEGAADKIISLQEAVRNYEED